MPTDQPTYIGPYRVNALIGREGPALLYRASAPGDGRAVIVHLLSPRMAEERGLLERFRREAGALARSGHPNLLRVLEIGEEGARPFMATEPFDGVPLDEVLKGRQLSAPEAIHVMKGICRGLAHAHQHGVVHGHVWPHAVLVSRDLSQVKLTDFGFARADSLGKTGTLNTGALSLGAFHYLAPEQVDPRTGGTADHRADLYSAGAVFHEMLTGRSPGGRFTLPSQLNGELTPDADVIVLKCLARNPGERYASAIDLLNDLARLEETMRVRVLSEFQGITRPGSRRRALLLAGLILLVAALAVAGFFIAR
jgi:serine/threonine-protein kinase